MTAEQRAALIEQFGGRCAYCGDHVRKRMAMEHVAPLSRGGDDHPDNILPSCASCNSSKSDMHPLEWVFCVYGLLVNGPNGPYVPAEPRRLQKHWMVAPKRSVATVQVKGEHFYEWLECGHRHYGGYLPEEKRWHVWDFNHKTPPKVGEIRSCYECMDDRPCSLTPTGDTPISGDRAQEPT